MESAVSAVFRSLGSAHRLQPSNASPSSMSQSTSRVLVSDANPLDDVPMEDISGPVVPAVVAPVKDFVQDRLWESFVSLVLSTRAFLTDKSYLSSRLAGRPLLLRLACNHDLYRRGTFQPMPAPITSSSRSTT
ncbi:unnamed protein product [Caenorhabditis nigoni]